MVRRTATLWLCVLYISANNPYNVPMKKNGAQIICELLKMHKINTVAGIPGGWILPLYDELSRSGIKHILVRQEQAAGFIAQGMARTTGLPAVCMATSGPGAMNLLTAIADARCDSIPIVAITGQVNISMIGTDSFQEADTFGLSFPITKHSMMIKSAAELFEAIPKAFEIAVSGRPGPVLLDIPRNVQEETIEFSSWPKINFEKKATRFRSQKKEIASTLNSILNALSEAERPVLYVGGGCNSAEGEKFVREFLHLYDASALSSLMGLGVVGADDDAFLGMIGMHGSVAANRAMHESDVVFACGSRFDDRAVGLRTEFCPNAKIIHIDIDAAEVNKIFRADLSLVCDIESALSVLNELLREKKSSFKKEKIAARKAWVEKNARLRKETFSIECGAANNSASVNPRKFIAEIPAFAKAAGTREENLIVTTDVGQHQMWAAQYFQVLHARTFLTSASLGTMGFGLPAAIGAALASPDKKIICFSGDGSIMMNVQELATLSELALNVTVIVLENGVLGMVRQQQKYIFKKNYSASVFSKSPDLLAIARGFGIEAFDANENPDWAKTVFAAKNKKPFFVRVRIDAEEDVLPFVMAGRANIDAIVN